MNKDDAVQRITDMNKAEAAREVIAQPRQDLVEQYRAFSAFLGYQSRRIYHPCSADDISPTTAFPDSHVTYADKDEKSIAAIQKLGLDATVADATEFDPGEVDLVILLNPGISPDVPVSHLVEGGYVLCNDWHQTATDLHNNHGYEFVGGITRNESGYVVDTLNPEDYWQEVQTDEEWQKTKFSWGDAGYEEAANIVELVTGKRENVLAEYRKIIENQREERRRDNEELLAENPEMEEMLQTLVDGDEFIMRVGKRTLVISAKLPKRKGTTEDVLVFRKKSQDEPIDK